MAFHEALERIAHILETCPPGSDGRMLVPLGALLDVMEHSAALLRDHGASHEADRLDAIRRGYLLRPRRVAQTAAPEGLRPRRQNRRPVPGRRLGT